MREALRALRSIRLAVILIAILACTGALSTLVPQELRGESYRALYGQSAAGRVLADLVIGSGLGHYARSPLFLVPAALFFVNLALCTVHRFRGQLGRKRDRNHGPDVIHVGLLILLLGAMASSLLREEHSAFLAPGQSAVLPDGNTLRLEDFTFLRYPNGRPKKWTSVVSISGKSGDSTHSIRVNEPARIGRLSLYQASWDEVRTLTVRDTSGGEYRLGLGDELSSEKLTIALAPEGNETGKRAGGTAIVNGQPLGLSEGATLDIGEGYRITLGTTLRSGLKVCIDPLSPLIFGALILIVLGLALTSIQKLRKI